MNRLYPVTIAGTLSMLALFSVGAGYDARTAPPGCRPRPHACTFAGSKWATVDTLGVFGDAHLTGAASSRAASYVVGRYEPVSVPGNGERWIVRRSLDRGETWATVDSFTTDPRQPFGATGVATDPRNGHVYVVGGATAQVEGTPWRPWFVRKSVDDGSTWSTIDDFALPTAFVGPSAVAVDGSGVVYVVGGASEIDSAGSTVGHHGVLRRSADGGATWTTQEFPEYERLGTVAATSEGRVFVGGPRLRIPHEQTSPWLIEHSADGVGGWSVADDVPDFGALAGLRASADGRVVAFGREVRWDGEGPKSWRWLMRGAMASAPTGWTTVDDYSPLDFTAGFGSASAGAATFALDGSIWSSGAQQHPLRPDAEFVTRDGNPPSKLFTESDRLAAKPAATVADEAFDLEVVNTTDGKGDILAAFQKPGATISDATWIVRKLRCH